MSDLEVRVFGNDSQMAESIEALFYNALEVGMETIRIDQLDLVVSFCQLSIRYLRTLDEEAMRALVGIWISGATDNVEEQTKHFTKLAKIKDAFVASQTAQRQ